jgi:hypothetical protein
MHMTNEALDTDVPVHPSSAAEEVPVAPEKKTRMLPLLAKEWELGLKVAGLVLIGIGYICGDSPCRIFTSLLAALDVHP